MTCGEFESGVRECSINVFELERTKDGVQKFENVSDHLLFVYRLKSVADGGTWLVTAQGEATASNSGLKYEVLDLTQSRLYAGWR